LHPNYGRWLVPQLLALQRPSSDGCQILDPDKFAASPMLVF